MKKQLFYNPLFLTISLSFLISVLNLGIQGLSFVGVSLCLLLSCSTFLLISQSVSFKRKSKSKVLSLSAQKGKEKLLNLDALLCEELAKLREFSLLYDVKTQLFYERATPVVLQEKSFCRDFGLLIKVLTLMSKNLPKDERIIDLKIKSDRILSVKIPSIELHEEVLWETFILNPYEKFCLDEIFDKLETQGINIHLKNNYLSNGECIECEMELLFASPVRVQELAS